MKASSETEGPRARGDDRGGPTPLAAIAIRPWSWSYAVSAQGARLITGGATPGVRRLALHPRGAAERWA